MTITLANGVRHPCGAGVHQFEGDWWACAVPDGVSRVGVRNEQDRFQMTELAIALYERLRTAPQYRYALVGVEVDDFRSFSEIDDDLITLDFQGLVLSDLLWRHIGSPDIYVPFESGYRWRPFRQI